MNILGISAFYHDSAASLVVDGRVLAAAQEERFSRRKHDPDFPRRAVEYCLQAAGISEAELDAVAYYDKPMLKFDRLLETHMAFWPRGFKLFRLGFPIWLKEKLHIPKTLDRGLKGRFKGRYIFLRHHESHAASAFFPSPFDEAAVLTVDGVGEWATTSVAYGHGNRLSSLRELRFPHSLGLLYSAFTFFCGFKVNSGEYKLMGLAPYGQPVFAQTMLDKLIDLKDDGSFRLNMDYFGYCDSDRMTSSKMAELFGGPPRRPSEPITRREMDLAASIQVVTEDIVLRMARYAKAATGSKNLAMAGGVALNCVANGKLAREKIFDNIWVQPAAGDAGASLGAAMFVWHQLLDNQRTSQTYDRQEGSLLGPSYGHSTVKAQLDRMGVTYTEAANEDALCDTVARLVADGNVVGHFQGRMEFGPRALGARSILADPRSAQMQRNINLKIKFRESFRPFAPAVLHNEASKYFQMDEGQESPYMLLVAPVMPEHLCKGSDSHQLHGLESVSNVRSSIPAVTHVDNSARIQTVDAERNPRFFKIVQRFFELTGVPMVINTSFNIRGEPIVESPVDAVRCFRGTDMDVLVVEQFVVKKDQQANPLRCDNQAYRHQFELD